MHTLLEENEEDDILCVQEPWFEKIGTARKDNAREGVDVLGGASHRNWNLVYPYFNNKQRAKVMIYVRKHSRLASKRRLHPIRTVPRLDLVRHHAIMITDLHIHHETLRIINFYHDVEDKTCLTTLTKLDLDPTVPTILVGDFNLHSPRWSPRGWSPSPRISEFETWAASQTLELATVPGEITRRGLETERPSTLDLVWHNCAAVATLALTPPITDWEASVGSDHAGIRSTWLLEGIFRGLKQAKLTSYKTDFEDESTEKAWLDELSALLPTLTPIHTIAELENAASSLQSAFASACQKHMETKLPQKARGNPWWSKECAAAAKALHAFPPGDSDERKAAARVLKRTVKKAKREYYDNIVTNGKIWEVAKWRLGRRMSGIPALRLANGALSFDQREISDTLAARFFVEDLDEIEVAQHDDPAPHHTRPLHPILNKEVTPLLWETANDSAPGESGISWKIIKMAWARVDKAVIHVFNACLQLGHHPSLWRKAVVVVIPKPGKDDYLAAKAYRPISLIECLSKLLEKVVAKRLLFDADKHSLLPTTQFGTRAFSCTLDAGLTLTHDVQTHLKKGDRCAALLFDIKGFFDHVHRKRMTHTLRNLGFAESIAGWVDSFLTDRRVTLSFNNAFGDERAQPIGTPQGSPISPILSALYTSPLLKLISEAQSSTLGMYVDDGIIFAYAKEWPEVNHQLRTRYTECQDWLRRSNLACKPDKTELIYFIRPRQSKYLPPPTALSLPGPSGSPDYIVHPSATVRYLGFFINHKLDWGPHVTTMCNRGRASLKALQMLGNSQRGISTASWRLVFNAVCLPVLTYGCQLWANSTKYKTLVKQVQMVMNEGVKVVAGAFRMAPQMTLHELTRILPASYYIEKLMQTSSLRLYHVPRTSQLLVQLSPLWDSSVQNGPHTSNSGVVQSSTNPLRSGSGKQRPTALEALGERIDPMGPSIDVTAIAPWEVHNWEAHVSREGVTNPKSRNKMINGLYSLLDVSSTVIIRLAGTVSNKNRYNNKLVGGVAASVMEGQVGTRSGYTHTLTWCLGTEVEQYDVDLFAISKATEWLADEYSRAPPPRNVYILSGNDSALRHITNTRSLDNQTELLTFHRALTKYYSTTRDTHIHLVWSPVCRQRSQDTGARKAALQACTRAPLSTLNCVQSATYVKRKARQRAYHQWSTQWTIDCQKTILRDITPYDYAITQPPDGRNHPLFSRAIPPKKLSDDYVMIT